VGIVVTIIEHHLWLQHLPDEDDPKALDIVLLSTSSIIIIEEIEVQLYVNHLLKNISNLTIDSS